MIKIKKCDHMVRRSVVDDWRLGNLSGSHLQSQDTFRVLFRPDSENSLSETTLTPDNHAKQTTDTPGFKPFYHVTFNKVVTKLDTPKSDYRERRVRLGLGLELTLKLTLITNSNTNPRVRVSVRVSVNPNLALKLTTRFQSFLGNLILVTTVRDWPK